MYKLFDGNVRFQFAALFFYLIILADYSRCRKTPQRSSAWYNCIMACTGVYLAFDLATCYALLGIFPQAAASFLMRCSIGALNTLTFALSMYVETVGIMTRKRKIPFYITWIPYGASMLIISFGSVGFTTDGMYFFPHGSMVNAAYASVLFYAIYAIAATIVYRKNIPAKKRISLRIGVIIWAVAVSLQFVDTHLPIASLGIVAELLILYLSYENPNESFDERMGTFNDKAFEAVVSEKLSRGENFSVVCFTVTDFDMLSKYFGHATAHKVMNKVTEYISSVLTKNLYHRTGKSMAAILKDDELNDEILERLKNGLAAPWDTMRGTVRLHFLICVIRCPDFAKELHEVQELLQYVISTPKYRSQSLVVADSGLLAAKAREDTITRIVSAAIKKRAFDVYYQPIYSVKEGRFVSAEALVRLQDKHTIGFVSPEEFIPIAERQGLINELGRIVFEKVCEFTVKENLPERGVHYIEVNLSGIQAIDSELPETLSGIVKSYGVAPGFINLEVTETAMVESAAQLTANMKRLREMGFSFSMDDFGTGYSNLSQVADVAYEIVKLDKSLVWPCFDKDTATAERAECVLECVCSMFNTMGVKIIAEGVETADMAHHLEVLGVAYFQGFYYSRPVPEEEYISYLSSHNE